MRKHLAFALVAIMVITVAITVYAETREHEYIEVNFGGDHHKSIGVHLNHLRATWDENGLNFISYFMTPWKGKIVYKDMLVISGDKLVYQLSKHRQLNVELHYQLTAKKTYTDKVYLTTPAKPFDYENGQIWWIIGYEEGGEAQQVAVVWKMKDNSITWSPYKDSE
ncbi:MAG TPA: hypothetical protein PKW95_17640 [bacterium]|nr:hypothetical protein [bacterium]